MAQHDFYVRGAAIMRVAFAVECGEIHAQILQRAGGHDRVDFRRCESRAVREHGNRKSGVEQCCADLDEAAILHALRLSLDAVFLPRPLKRVAALPRNATGKLPREALLEMLAR